MSGDSSSGVPRGDGQDEVGGRGGGRVRRADGDGRRRRPCRRPRAARPRGRARRRAARRRRSSSRAAVQKNSSCAHSSSSCAPPGECADSISFARPKNAVPRLGPPPRKSIFAPSGKLAGEPLGRRRGELDRLRGRSAWKTREAFHGASGQLGRADRERVERARARRRRRSSRARTPDRRSGRRASSRPSPRAGSRRRRSRRSRGGRVARLRRRLDRADDRPEFDTQTAQEPAGASSSS